ncbi:TetR family transcriptional regulator [Massilia dura]|uniref:TetR family transcriptional regulator n=1 Tax=Pseudoduganella dura TaxID=321982 RepID=A0A6I3XD07_9BURK|nr:TetR/AcrR family transcriptional regulator [Pseudoduganella dura]MUI14399.1 TetR family transcriptional regulator [Pseudoduganella dura]GGY05631.1 TetR family transcriptional regulator [Pseudoduganella dura]
MRTKSPVKRQSIIDAAAAAFEEFGVAETSISQIVQRIGGSKATIYSHFASKEELVGAVMLRMWVEQMTQVFLAFEAADDLQPALARFARAYLNILLQPAIMTLTRSAMLHGDSTGRDVYEKGPKRGWDLVASRLQHWSEKNIFPAVDTQVAALHLKGLLQAELFDKVLFGFPVPDRQEVDAVADRAVQAFLGHYALRLP